MKPMNLLFIMSDQHSKEKMGAYGNPYISTPNLDRLCENGVRFNNAYCNNPICVPSRAAMACGDFGFRHSYWDNSHPYEGAVKSWGHRLTGQGYHVTTIGKLHFKDEHCDTGFPEQLIPLHVKDGIGNLTVCIRDLDIKRPNQRDVLLKAGAGESEYIQYDKKVAKLAAEFLKNESQRLRDKPFCLYVGFVTPHFPLTVPDDILEMYKPFEKLPFPTQWKMEERPNHPALVRFRELSCTEEKSVTEETVRRAVACYYGLVTFMDRQVGVVLDALKEAGLSDSTRIIYTSDHGDTMGDHGVFFKNTMYEGSVGIPMVLAGPDIPSGKQVNDNVSLIDIYPSVLECMGIAVSPEECCLPGHSLWDYALGKKVKDRPVMAESHTFAYRHAVFMLRYKKYKLIYYAEKGYWPQLFDLETDPKELEDLGENPQYEMIIQDMKKRLFEICDPEQIDRQALREQENLLKQYGGREAVLNSMDQYYFSYSPIPDNSLQA